MPEAFKRCVKKVSRQKGAKDAYAICTAADAGGVKGVRKKEKRSECAEALEKIEASLLKEWDMQHPAPSIGDERLEEPLSQGGTGTAVSGCAFPGCTHMPGHGGGHVDDDAAALAVSTGPRSTGFANADRIDGISDAMSASTCSCAGHCYESANDCPCVDGCGRDCGCPCYDEAGPIHDDGI